jgi:hypothetical protein
MGRKKSSLAKRKWPSLSCRVEPAVHQLVDEYLDTLEYKPTVQQWLESLIAKELEEYKRKKSNKTT